MSRSNKRKQFWCTNCYESVGALVGTSEHHFIPGSSRRTNLTSDGARFVRYSLVHGVPFAIVPNCIEELDFVLNLVHLWLCFTK